MNRPMASDTLRKAARRAGLTQWEIALKLRRSESSVSKWFAGVARPRPDVARRLAKLLGLKLEDIYR